MNSRPWTLEGLAALYAVIGGWGSLEDAAQALGRLRSECDLALWELTGRTPEQALAVLNATARPDREPVRVQSRTLRGFLARLFR